MVRVSKAGERTQRTGRRSMKRNHNADATGDARTVISINTNGDGIPDMGMELTGHITLQQDNFISHH